MKRFTENYNNQTFDILIIGGGITGATIAYEAALRGLNTALIEKNDFASGTSSASSRMIHGGLRYLATGQLHLVHESLLERRILANIAPNFVIPLPFIFVIYNYMHTPLWAMHSGMTMYELLSLGQKKAWDKSKKIPHFSYLSKQAIAKHFPQIKLQNLQGGFLYYDYRNHSPERMTLSFIKSALHYGAQVANYTQMEKFIYEQTSKGTQIKGIVARDLLTNRILKLKARLVINAAGPWADIVLSRTGQNKEIKHIRRSEGIHIVIDKKFSDKFVFASQSPDSEHFFLIPYREKTIIGTTDKEYNGNPDNYKVTKESVDELLNKVNSALKPNYKIQYKDIAYIYGGLRPLVEDTTSDVYRASRKYEIEDEEKNGIHGLISAEGGKFTTSRRLAEKVINLAQKKLGYKPSKSTSADQHLITSKFSDIEQFIKKKAAQYPMMNNRQIRYLIYSYGSEIDNIMNLYLSNPKLQHFFNKDGENLAQVVFAIRSEMAQTLTDIIMRRTGIGSLGMPDENSLNLIALTAAQELNWTQEQINEQINEIKQIFYFPNMLKSINNETQYDIPA